MRQFTVVALGVMLVFAGATQEVGPTRLNLFDPAPKLDLRFVKGKAITIAEGRGKNVFVVEYWATWCAPCKRSIPHLTKLQERYEDEGLVVIGISDEPLAKVQSYVAKMGEKMNYRVAIDPSGATTRRYMRPFEVNSIPHAFVIDKAGRIMWHGNPMDAILEPLIDALLEEEVDAEDDE